VDQTAGALWGSGVGALASPKRCTGAYRMDSPMLHVTGHGRTQRTILQMQAAPTCSVFHLTGVQGTGSVPSRAGAIAL